MRALLARAEATEDDLELGPQEGRPPQKIHHNCSGKHAGMLALCRARGWPTQGYRLPEHPVQQACREAHAEAAEVEPTSSRPPPTAAASSPSRSRSSGWRTRTPGSRRCPAATRVAAAMRARPDLVGGPDGADFLLMRAAPGWLAKGGAEGLLCAAGPDGLGVALKSEDGASRAHAPALAAFLGALGVDLPDLASSAGRQQPRRARRRDRGVTRALTSSLRIAKSLTSIRLGLREDRGAGGAGLGSVVATLSCNLGRGGSGTCSPSTSRFLRSKSSRSSSPTGRRRASSPTTRSPPVLEDVELTKEQVEDFYTYLIEHSVDARRGRAAQGAAARAAAARGREARRGAEARPHRRAVARLPPPLPARDRQGAAPHRRPGGDAREADRARRHGREDAR